MEEEVKTPLSGPEGQGGTPEKKMEHISDLIGDYGRYQRYNSWVHASLWIYSPFIVLVLPYYAPPVTPYCADNDPAINNTTQDVCNCTKWRYESKMDVTIISEWDLVCDRSWLASATQSAFMVGMFLSLLIASPLTDRYGRKRLFVIGMIFEIIAGILAISAQSIVQFIVARFLLGLFATTRVSGAGLMFFEYLGPESRTWWTIVGEFVWILACMSLPLVAYALRHFRYLLLFGTVPLFFYLPISYWMPESARWLMSRKRFDEAKQILETATKMNGLYDETFETKFAQLKKHFLHESSSTNGEPIKKKRNAFLQLFRLRIFRVALLVLLYSWFIHSLIYYGITLNIDKFGADMFISNFLSALSELPSILINYVAVKYVGRRPLFSIQIFAAGFFCLGFIWVRDPSQVTIRMSLALLCKTMISGSYMMMALVTKEVFPTVIRQSSIGFLRGTSRIASIMAPFVKELAQVTSMTVIFIGFGVLATVDGILVRYLPETRGKEIPDTLHDMKTFEWKTKKVENGEAKELKELTPPEKNATDA